MGSRRLNLRRSEILLVTRILAPFFRVLSQSLSVLVISMSFSPLEWSRSFVTNCNSLL
jgi:hypothetical protein